MLLALILLQSANPDPAYMQCAERNLIRLEVSEERPKDIAAAAVDACSSVAPAYNMSGLRALRTALIDRLASRIVEIRACRKTKGCDPRKLR